MPKGKKCKVATSGRHDVSPIDSSYCTLCGHVPMPKGKKLSEVELLAMAIGLTRHRILCGVVFPDDPPQEFWRGADKVFKAGSRHEARAFLRALRSGR